jgi:uncharacterized protein YcfL
MKKFVVLFVAIFALVSCSKDDDNDITVDQNSLELYSKDFHQITTNQSNPTYSSENEFVAQVSSSGLVTAKHIGNTYIDINGTRKVEVTVKAKYSLLEPLHDFTLTKADVISKRGSATVVGDTTLTYKNPANNILAEMYMFSKKTGKMNSSAIIYSTSDFTDINYALAERYQPYTYDDANYYFVFIDAMEKSDAKMFVISKIYNLNYSITLYEPINDTANAAKMMTKLGELNLILK